jgi:hypothetical protein
MFRRSGLIARRTKMIVRTNCSTTAISLSFAALITLLALPVSRPVLGQGAGQQSPMGRQAVLPGPSDDLLAKLESTYKDIHANPELSMQERRTAGIAANWLREQGYEVTEGVGGTGVVGLLRNGAGATVLLRADMDALPMRENTGLPYASTKTGTDPSSGRETGIAHSCGHDMHVAWRGSLPPTKTDGRAVWSPCSSPGRRPARALRLWSTMVS